MIYAPTLAVLWYFWVAFLIRLFFQYYYDIIKQQLFDLIKYLLAHTIQSIALISTKR